MRTFQYRLFPNKDQQDKLWLHANKLNDLYNYFLTQRNENYKNNIIIKKSQQQKELVKLKENDKTLSEIHSQALQQVTLRLDNSYKNFFARLLKKNSKPGFPKRRDCRNFFGICYPQKGYKINNNIFETKVYGKIKFYKHRDIKGEVKQVFISCKNNKFYLNITTDYTPKKSGKSSIGIDIGLKKLIIGVDGTGKVIESIENKRHAKYFDKQIDKIKSRRSKCKKDSNQYIFFKKVEQRLYDAKVNKINDFQHKVSKRLGSTYDTIFAENLSVKKMSEGHLTNLNRSIRNAKLSQLITFLGYKTNNLVLVNPKNTSKTCNNCGKIRDIKLSDRTIKCTCGIEYDRDENAAKNIYCLGQAVLAKPEYVGSLKLTIQEAITFR